MDLRAVHRKRNRLTQNAPMTPPSKIPFHDPTSIFRFWRDPVQQRRAAIGPITANPSRGCPARFDPNWKFPVEYIGGSHGRKPDPARMGDCGAKAARPGSRLFRNGAASQNRIETGRKDPG
jgi:hypothetical protein